MNNNTTFWNLISSYKISIPIIQRDYAQGRVEESEKREKFLSTLFSHLSSGEKLHLDFVYGRVKDDIFYPIDGQQRLTTLFLLHWYFALKEQVNGDLKMKLTQFVYDTRISSREFCAHLVKEEILIPSSDKKGNFLDSIKNRHWYRTQWDSDPTIKAMLIMIQAIHDKFKDINRTDVFELLINQNVVSFELLDLGVKGFELTDELYIKMNARGKQLTPFENFKANFIQLIDRNFKTQKLKHPIKGNISYSGYFSYKIEKEWTDLFWAYRGDKKTTDEVFSNFFEFLTQMLFFKQHKDLNADEFKNSFAQYKDVFSSEENLLFLFGSLDTLYQIAYSDGKVSKVNLDAFFKDISSNVSLFWNTTIENNLFERIIDNTRNEDVRNKVMLFSIIYYAKKHRLETVETSLKQFARVVRNLLQATRQRSETKYNTNIRVNLFGYNWMLFEMLSVSDVYAELLKTTTNSKNSRISEASLENEITKARILSSNSQEAKDALLGLEEMNEFGGLIQQLRPKENQNKLPDYFRAAKEIWSSSISDTSRIQALICSGFEGLHIKDTKMGKTHYFGRNTNWSSILTSENTQASNAIISLLENYANLSQADPNEKINSIISPNLFSHKLNKPLDYFLKYPDFTCKLNYFVNLETYELRMLSTEGSNPLVAYHINPFVLTTCKMVNNEALCWEGDCFRQYSETSPLYLKNGVSMESINEGWKIPTHSLITPEIVSKYHLEITDEVYLLKENINKDRIEIATDFINEFL